MLRRSKMCWMFCSLFIAALFALPTVAQDTRFITNLVMQPNPSSFLSDWQREIRVATLSLTYTGNEPVSFYTEVLMNHDDFGDLFSAKSAYEDLPGPITKIYNGPDLTDWKDVRYLNNSIRDKVFRTNRLPAGGYTLTLTMKDVNANVLNRVSGRFTISYPDPPQLVLPQNFTQITNGQPTFQWNRLLAGNTSVHYALKIVERIGQQNINQAINANQIHHQAEIIDLGYYTYPQDALPLMDGKEYVWQLTATDAEGNILSNNDGKSEIWSFSFLQTNVTQFPYQQIWLVENVASVINVQNLQITQDQTSYFFQPGNATIRVILPGGGVIEKEVMLPSFVAAKRSGILSPVVSSGVFSYSLLEEEIPAVFSNSIFKPSLLSFQPSEGLALGGNLSLPGNSSLYPISGKCFITRNGFSGTLSTIGNSLFSISSGNIRLDADKIEVEVSRLPGFRLSGKIQSADGAVSQIFDNISVINGGCTIRLNGSSSAIALTNGSRPVLFTPSSVTGIVQADLFTRTLTPAIQINGLVSVPLNGNTALTIAAELGYSPEGDFQLLAQSSTSTARAVFGAAELSLFRPIIKRFIKEPAGWDFELECKGTLGFPALGGLLFPEIPNIKITPAGLSLPQTVFSELSTNGFRIEGVTIQPSQAEISPLSLSLSELVLGTIPNASIQIEGALRFLNLPSGYPQEMKNLSIPLSFSVNFTSLQIDLPLTRLGRDGARIPVGKSFFRAKSITGSVNGSNQSGSFTVSANILLQGGLELPRTLTAGTGAPDFIEFDEKIRMTGNGILSGSFSAVSTPNPVKVGVYSIQFLSATLMYGNENDTQTALLQGSGKINLSQGTASMVTAVFDLMTGKFTSIISN